VIEGNMFIKMFSLRRK